MNMLACLLWAYDQLRCSNDIYGYVACYSDKWRYVLAIHKPKKGERKHALPAPAVQLDDV